MPEVTAAAAKDLIDDGAQLIDIRTEAEFTAGHIPGSRHIPLSDVPQQAGHLDGEQAVILYCRSGNRSGPAADAFAASGWNAHSIEGGLLAWADAGLGIEPDGGAVIDNPNMPPR